MPVSPPEAKIMITPEPENSPYEICFAKYDMSYEGKLSGVMISALIIGKN